MRIFFHVKFALLIILVGFSRTNGASEQKYYLTAEYPIGPSFWGPSIDITPEGTVLLADMKTGRAVEFRKGQVVREYSYPNSTVRGVGFGPDQERLIVYWISKGAALNVYDKKGRKILDVSCPDMAFPQRLEVDQEGQIIMLGFARSLIQRPNLRTAGQREKPLLIYKYDKSGRELTALKAGEAFASNFTEFTDRPMGRVLLAAGTAGEVALFRWDRKIIYWLDSRGEIILRIPFERHPTAIGFVNGVLMAASGYAKSVSSPTPGVYATTLTDPYLTEFYRNGKRVDIPLPAKAMGITKIDRGGNLLKLTQDSLFIFSRVTR